MLRRGGSNNSNNDGPIPGTLAVLPLPARIVILPGASVTLRLHRKDSVALLQHILTSNSNNNGAPIIAAAPLRIKQDNDPEIQIIRLPQNDGNGQSNIPGDAAARPSVDDINEWACASRISRIERVSSTTVINGVSTSQHDYVITLQGICRVRIDRFTQVGTPFFQALVTAFPSSSSKLANVPDDAAEAIPQDLVDRMADIANNVLDILAAVAGSSTPSNKAARTPSIPSPAPPLPALAIKRLRSALKGMTVQNADDISDLLLSSLLPVNRQASYPAKLHHLSLYAGAERVLHACSQLETLKTELDSREAVGIRYANNMTRKTKEMVLRGLMEAIRQELLALRKQQQDGDDDDSSSNGSNNGIRVIRVGNGNGNNPLGSPTSSASGHNNEEDEEEDELAGLGQKIHDSSMPPDARTIALREYKRLKTIPPQSIEHGGIRNYLDWLLDLPWGTSSNSTISNDFLNKAKQQLDDDHFGIDRVKERLLQYLAVLRLRNEAFENEEMKWREEEKRLAEEEEKVKRQQEEEEAAKAKAVAAAKPEDGVKSKAVVPYDSSKSNKRKVSPASQQDGKRLPPASPSPTSTAMVKQQQKEIVPKLPRPQRKDKGPILLLVGPPGVGKTSIAKSLANALGRPYHRISLGGVRDEAEIRGFRRTYVGSQPGVFVQALRKVKVNNPVFLLDEIDKLTSGAGFHGDPSAAMLEVLDPEQNFSFNDHYINTPVDLSSVLFIATANNLSTIPPPLLDRMEVIHLSGYVDIEKLQIARRYLLPKQIKANQLQSGHIDISDEVILDVINRYCSGESGVRTLERQMGSIVRWKAVEFARVRDSFKAAERPSLDATSVKGYDRAVKKEDLEVILGNEYHEFEKVEDDEEARPGVANGLAYTGSGNGDIMRIEITSFPGKGNLRLTGSLGDVISESSQLALSWIRTNAYELGLTNDKKEDIMREIDLHLHMPAGSIKKEGPSAGVAIVMAMVSLFSGHALDNTLAMTGEITLRGKVTPVGGIKEKVLAAHRAGIKRVMLPIRNKKDILANLPQRIKDDIQIDYVQDIWQALDIAFGDRLWQTAPDLMPSGARLRRPEGFHVPSRL